MRVAILYPGDREQRDLSDPKQSRFNDLFGAFGERSIHAEPAVYNDDFVDEIKQQLAQVDTVLVWHNPIEGQRTRAVLDAMLREVAAFGVTVSTHPDTILKLGTKDVLLSVKDTPFGSDVYRIERLEQLADEVAVRLQRGPRVLKQYRGHSGKGVWRIEALSPAAGSPGETQYLLRHAERGAVDERLRLSDLIQRLAPYFEHDGHMIDQAWQPRLTEGMVRAYLVRGKVAGYGHQAVNALFPARPGEQAPLPGPRLYSDQHDARFQTLRHKLENGWLDLLCRSTGLSMQDLPMLWDADFFFGEPTPSGEASYVLCEINVSSVSPFPPSAIVPLVDAVCSLPLK